MFDHVLEVTAEAVSIVAVKENTATRKDWKSSITFSYEGSILSTLKEGLLRVTARIDSQLQGVIYLYKTTQGFTQSIPFFSIPSLRKKLSIMGPGEAFVDTN